MKIKFLCNIIVLCFAKSATGENAACNVTVGQGTLVGESIDLVTGDGKYCSYKGIPYAQPPIGPLRFKAPLPASAWSGVRNATEHGSVCPQIDILTNELIPGNEDCLFLNVYSPNSTCTDLSVLVHIHGGGFQSGSGNVASLGPDFFLRKDFDIIVVTINYRVDALGFLCLDNEEVPGNAGLKDQAMALKWVQTNIKYFGGDPNKVTIMGQSAGSASVGYHLASPMSAGLFKRAIALSGSPYNDWAILTYQPKLRALKLGKQLGFRSTNTTTLLSYLQNVTSTELVNYTAPYILACEQITATLTKQYQFGPVVEKYYSNNSFLSKNWLYNNFSHVNKADIMFGHTNQEGVTLIPLILSTLFTRYDAFIENFATRKVCEYFAPDVCLMVGARVRDYYMGNKSIDVNATKEFVNYVTEASFQYDIVRYFSQIPNKGTKYMYQFSSLAGRNEYGANGIQYGISGAGHFDDLSYLFDPKKRNLTLEIGSIEFQIIDRLTTFVKNFIHYGKPTINNSSFNVTWPEFNNATMKYLDIGTTNLTVLTVKDKPYYNFWLGLLQSVGVMY